MKKVFICLLFTLPSLLFAQISLSEKAVDYFSLYNLTEGGKLSNMMVDLEPQSFLMLGPDFSNRIYMENDVTLWDLDMHYRMNRVGFGPVSLSAEYRHSLLRIDNYSNYDEERRADKERFRRDHPELADKNLDSSSLNGSLVFLEAFEFGGMKTNVDDIDYESYELNVLDLSKVFGQQYLYIGEKPVFKLSRLRTFNIFTRENRAVPAFSSYTYLGIPLLNSFSYDIFPEDELYFVSPTFNVTTGPFMLFATPRWEAHNSRFISLNIATDWAYFILSTMDDVNPREMEMMKDFMSANIRSSNRHDYYNNGSFRILLGYEYGQYNPYISLDDKMRYHEIVLQLDTYILGIDRRPYSPNAMKENARGNDSHSPYRGPFGLTMHAGADMGIRFTEDRKPSMVVRYYFKLGYPWFRHRPEKEIDDL